jgi:cobalt-zinc-cadmium efflux system protein
VTADTDRRYLWGALIVLAVFAVGEAVVALVTNSLALLTDAFHMLSDIAAIAAAIWALRIAARPATARLTFGWRRAEILSALLNGATLIIVGGFLGYEAIRRLFDPPEISGSAVLITALVGVAVNLVATWLLAKANRASLNVEGAYQHVLTDLYAFIGTVIAGVVMITTGWARADSVASLFVCALMLRSGWHLVRAAGWILLEATPKDYDLAEIRDHLMAIDGVVDVHDLHVWTVSDSLPLASAHVTVSDHCFTDGHATEVLRSVQECLRGHFDVEHSTFQVEPETLAAHADLH